MSYTTGTANSFADLLTALRNACIAAGWTLSGDVLHKGTCYAEIKVGDMPDTAATPGQMIYVRMGNGIDVSNNLTDPMTIGLGHGIGVIRQTYSGAFLDWDWPVSYHVHVHANPDEVFFVVNYRGATIFQHLYFGQSPAPGCGGTGNWSHATVPEPIGTNYHYFSEERIACSPSGLSPSWYYGVRLAAGPFWVQGRGASNSILEGCLNFQFHGAPDFTDGTPGWSSKYGGFSNGGASTFGDVNRTVSAVVCDTPLLGRTPNAWNNETILCPIQIASPRVDSKTSIVGRLGHIRMCRNDFIEDGGIITLGPDKWKVYPCFKKGTGNRDGYTASNLFVSHSGTVAVAIRYDGP